MQFQCSFSTNTELIHFDYCYYGEWQTELAVMNQALAGERGLGSAPPAGTCRARARCGAVKMMEGTGKGIVWQIKKIP